MNRAAAATNKGNTVNLQFKIVTNQSQASDGRETTVAVEITDAQIEKIARLVFAYLAGGRPDGRDLIQGIRG